MLFDSFAFFVFFPIVTILYFILPHRFRWVHLLIASCIFYMAFIPQYILILFLLIGVDYVAGILIASSTGNRRKWYLGISLASNIGILAFFKYYNFFAGNLNGLFHDIPLLKIALPIGLSFHTFQAMSYTIEVYRGNQKAERHLGIYALYVMFFPQLVAGPIERPQNVLHQYREKKVFDYESVKSGLVLMLWGLFKKAVIADRLAYLTDMVFNNPRGYGWSSLVLGVVFFSFQIYCDFSGYSDIALGSARILGVKLMRNFDAPYESRSISEFWKRWHISLSTWFRDYLYIPMGGNRVAVPRWYFNLFFVFVVSGFWHGANWTFLIWGALHGFYLVFAIVTQKWRDRLAALLGVDRIKWLYGGIQALCTFGLVTFAWIFFRAGSLSDALYMARGVLRLTPVKGANVVNQIGRTPIGISILLILGLLLTEFANRRYRFGVRLQSYPKVYRWGLYYLLLLVVLGLSVYTRRYFIYFQF